MKKSTKIIYWISTVWMALGMVSTGMVQTMQLEEETAFMLKLGYPAYFIAILGICKLAGTVVILLPKFPLLKEWAYAGFIFTMAGALVSHLVCKSPLNETFPSVLLLVLTLISMFTRPASRRIQVQSNPIT